MNIRYSLLALLLLLFSSNSFAKDIYVKAGSTGGDGTQSKPYATVDDALRKAFSGDVIHVAKGDYFGPGGSGLFMIEKPNLTLVGGYDDSFSSRDPFKNITRLMRGASTDPKDCTGVSARCKTLVERQKIPTTKAQYNGKGIVVGGQNHENFILDGFVIDGFTRSTFKPNEDLSLSKGPLGTACVEMYKPGVKIRNNIILNCSGPGIQMAALGTKLPRGDSRESGDDWNEASNNIIFNSLGKHLSFKVGNMSSSDPNKGAALIKNNTLAFSWEFTGENENLVVGSQTRLTVKDNIFAFADLGISNGLGNNKARLIGNVFFGHNAGHYEYMERSNSTLILDDVTQLEGMNCKEKYKCSKQSKNNITTDPKFKNVDNFVLDKFFNQIASKGGGKVTMDLMNQWRQAVGLNLQGSKGSGRQNYAPVWDPGANWENARLFTSNASLSGKGAQSNGIDGSFPSYKSTSSQVANATPKNYQSVTAADITKGGKLVGQIASSVDKGMDLSTEILIKQKKVSDYYLDSKNIKRESWDVYQDDSYTLYVYVKKGSADQAIIDDGVKQGIPVILKGTAYPLEGKALHNKLGFVVDKAESTDED